MKPKQTRDWTVDPKTGRSNSSKKYLEICRSIEGVIRKSAYDLIAGRADATARLIVAQIAHVHGLAPKPRRKAK